LASWSREDRMHALLYVVADELGERLEREVRVRAEAS